MTRLCHFSIAQITGRISDYAVRVTRTAEDDGDFPAEYRCELVSGDCDYGDLDDVEEAAIRVFEEELAEEAEKGRAA